MPIVILNSSSSKTNRSRRIKVSNLEASGHALSAFKSKFWQFRHFFFFIYSFIYLFIFSFFIYLSKLDYGNKNSKTTKARNLKFGQIIGLYINLRPCNFGGATSSGLGKMHPKLVTTKFIKWFYGRMVNGASAWSLRPEFNYLLGQRFYQTKIISIYDIRAQTKWNRT